MIAMAKQDGQNVRVYNERGIALFVKRGILQGYTSTTVTIKDSSSSTIRVFDEHGTVTFIKW